MVEERVQRRLAAILAADITGYSRLMGEDEEGTLSALTAHRTELIEPCIAEHSGRVVKTTGDGLLAEFASVVDAVRCAVVFQEGMRERNTVVPKGRRIEYRIGVNLGDVIVQDGDVYGDGVNVAARLEGLAEPGGVCISISVYDQIEGKLDLYFEDIGVREVKNIAKPVHAFFVRPSSKKDIAQSSPEKRGGLRHDVRFCMAPDGVQIAYSAVGEGLPLVRTANWLNHLEYDWESPVWRHALRALADDYRLVRYDQRGAGLSDWDVADISFDAWVTDLETVVDAAGLERFPILGISQGCSVAIAYAVRHPERVSALVLYGGYTRGRNKRDEVVQAEQDAAMLELIRIGWGQANPAFRQVFTSLIFPDATPEQMEAFNELQRRTTTPDNAVRIRETSNNIEVTDLAPRVTAPTLVMHVRDDATVPFEEGRRLAARIPDARFVALEGRNHLILEDEPAWPRFIGEIRSFLNANQNGSPLN